MSVERTLGVLVLLVAAGGCPMDGGDGTDAGPDPTPIITVEQFSTTTWSLSAVGGAAQLSLTDGVGNAACALSQDQRVGLGAAGVQIIMRLPGTVTETCPQGKYTITKCAASMGSEAFVPEGCAFYRRWDAQGTSLGIAAALNGEITISGTTTECFIRANVGFLGLAFAETYALLSYTGAQPWCR